MASNTKRSGSPEVILGKPTTLSIEKQQPIKPMSAFFPNAEVGGIGTTPIPRPPTFQQAIVSAEPNPQLHSTTHSSIGISVSTSSAKSTPKSMKNDFETTEEHITEDDLLNITFPLFVTQQRDASPIGDAWTLVPSLHLPEFRFSASAIQQAIKRGAQLLGKSAVQGTTEETQFGYFLNTETDTAVVKTESVFSSVEQINDQISCFIRAYYNPEQSEYPKVLLPLGDPKFVQNFKSRCISSSLNAFSAIETRIAVSENVVYGSVIVPRIRFTMIPISPLRVLNIPLLKKIETSRSPLFGLLTLDQSRRLVLLEQEDPLCYDMPIVGIWVSCVRNNRDISVWSACCQYSFSSAIKNRATQIDSKTQFRSFLVVEFSVHHDQPVFFHCSSNVSHNLPLASLEDPSGVEWEHFDFETPITGDVIQARLSRASYKSTTRTSSAINSSNTDTPPKQRTQPLPPASHMSTKDQTTSISLQSSTNLQHTVTSPKLSQSSSETPQTPPNQQQTGSITCESGHSIQFNLLVQPLITLLQEWRIQDIQKQQHMQMQLDTIANKVETLSALVERIAVTSKVVIPSTNFGTTSAKSHKRHSRAKRTAHKQTSENSESEDVIPNEDFFSDLTPVSPNAKSAKPPFQSPHRHRTIAQERAHRRRVSPKVNTFDQVTLITQKFPTVFDQVVIAQSKQDIIHKPQQVFLTQMPQTPNISSQPQPDQRPRTRTPPILENSAPKSSAFSTPTQPSISTQEVVSTTSQPVFTPPFLKKGANPSPTPSTSQTQQQKERIQKITQQYTNISPQSVSARSTKQSPGGFVPDSFYEQDSHIVVAPMPSLDTTTDDVRNICFATKFSPA